jgi:hypothetical protein
MATKNQRIAAYVPESVYQKYQSFKAEKGLGDSQALIQILSEYFGVAHQVAHSESPHVLERITQLEASLSAMRSDLLSELKELVLKELAPQAVIFAISPSEGELVAASSFEPQIIDVPQEEDKALFPESESLGNSLSESPELEEISLLLPESVAPPILLLAASEFPQIVLSKTSLAERFKAGLSTISTRKKDSPEKFAAWSQSKDPDGVSWKANLDGTFSPIGEVPELLKDALTNMLSDGLSNGSLAKRLGVPHSTLSHWRSDKTSDEFLSKTRDRDPDRIGWIFNQETKRFTSEREIPSDSPRATQSELPGISIPEEVEF